MTKKKILLASVAFGVALGLTPQVSAAVVNLEDPERGTIVGLNDPERGHIPGVVVRDDA